MYLTPEEIKTHLYNGVVEEISREDESILKAAISAAEEEARGYLTAYDTGAIFSTLIPDENEGSEPEEPEDDRNPILLLFVKDIAVWHYIQLANPAVDMQLRLMRYEKAIEFLTRVQSGKVNPDLPYPAEPPLNEADNYIKFGSNFKRILNY